MAFMGGKHVTNSSTDEVCRMRTIYDLGSEGRGTAVKARTMTNFLLSHLTLALLAAILAWGLVALSPPEKS